MLIEKQLYVLVLIPFDYCFNLDVNEKFTKN